MSTSNGNSTDGTDPRFAIALGAIPLGPSLGALFGVAAGSGLGNTTLGIAVGVAVGAGIGSAVCLYLLRQVWPSTTDERT